MHNPLSIGRDSLDSQFAHRTHWLMCSPSHCCCRCHCCWLLLITSYDYLFMLLMPIALALKPMSIERCTHKHERADRRSIALWLTCDLRQSWMSNITPLCNRVVMLNYPSFHYIQICTWCRLTDLPTALAIRMCAFCVYFLRFYFYCDKRMRTCERRSPDSPHTANKCTQHNHHRINSLTISITSII